jgi:hypothetical protein
MDAQMMPDVISKQIHNFLRGTTWESLERKYSAKDKWHKKNAPLGFQLGQIYRIYTGKYEDYKVIKVGAMVSFQSLSTGEVFRRKPILKKEHTAFLGDTDLHYDEVASWSVKFKCPADGYNRPTEFTLTTLNVHSPK